MLVVGGAPAAAVEDGAVEGVPAAASTWRACVGPATAVRGFSDVSAGSTHFDSINCLAYYGITTGKTADTFDPGGYVTRSQMAPMRHAAGVRTANAMDAPSQMVPWPTRRLLSIRR